MALFCKVKLPLSGHKSNKTQLATNPIWSSRGHIKNNYKNIFSWHFFEVYQLVYQLLELENSIHV